MQNKLTDLAIRTVPNPETGHQMLWDTTVRGFGVRIGKLSRTFVVLIGNGRRQTIGRYPDITLGSAREEARRILAEKQLGKVKPTHVAFDDAKAQFLAHSATKNRASTVRDYRWRLDRHYAFGRAAIADITPRDILRRLNTLNSTPAEKRYAFAVGRAFFRWCVRHHIIDRSPMENMEPPAIGKSRARVLSDDELQALIQSLDASRYPFHAIIHLLILTGQRRGEIASLEWDWIGKDTITIPASVTKNGRLHVFPIGPQATKIIASLPRISENYLFPASRNMTKATTTFNGWSKPKVELDKLCGLENWTIHDLRRTFATNMQRLGVRLEVTEAMLNHVSGTQGGIVGVYQRYNWLPEMKAAILQWEQYLATLTEPKALST